MAKEKARGLREMYAADKKTCGYFDLHSTADVVHAQIWRQQLARASRAESEGGGAGSDAAGNAAKALWRALDGVERGEGEGRVKVVSRLSSVSAEARAPVLTTEDHERFWRAIDWKHQWLFNLYVENF